MTCKLRTRTATHWGKICSIGQSCFNLNRRGTVYYNWMVLYIHKVFVNLRSCIYISFHMIFRVDSWDNKATEENQKTRLFRQRWVIGVINEGGKGYFGMWDLVILSWDFLDLYMFWDLGCGIRANLSWDFGICTPLAPLINEKDDFKSFESFLMMSLHFFYFTSVGL